MKTGSNRFVVSVIASAGVLMLAVSTVFAMNMTKKDAEKREMDVQRPLIKVVEVLPESVTFEVKSRGTVQPHTETTLVAEVSGRVVEVSPALCAGGVFEAGDELLRLDDGDYQASLSGAQAELAVRSSCCRKGHWLSRHCGIGPLLAGILRMRDCWSCGNRS